jgi:hypothetical protein
MTTIDARQGLPLAPMSAVTSSSSTRRGRAWPFWPVVPLYPYGQRPTQRVEVVKDQVWTFEQFQGIFYVVVPIRMTVVRLEPKGLAGVLAGGAYPRMHCPGARAGGAPRPSAVHRHVDGDGH